MWANIESINTDIEKYKLKVENTKKEMEKVYKSYSFWELYKNKNNEQQELVNKLISMAWPVIDEMLLKIDWTIREIMTIIWDSKINWSVKKLKSLLVEIKEKLADISNYWEQKDKDKTKELLAKVENRINNLQC